MSTEASTIAFKDTHITLLEGDVLNVLPTLPAEAVHMVATSPPYY